MPSKTAAKSKVLVRFIAILCYVTYFLSVNGSLDWKYHYIITYQITYQTRLPQGKLAQPQESHRLK